MTDPTIGNVPRGLADLPLEERHEQEVERQRELQEGLTSRHLANAAFAHAYQSDQFNRALKAASVIAAK